MKALILNGERKNESSLARLEEIIRTEMTSIGWSVESVLLREKTIAKCMGCFDCWVKTPGVCMINDYGRRLTGMVATSDLVVFLTPVTFGGYSSELKKAIDRFGCPMLLPYFTKVNGEVHHKLRYKPSPDSIGIGVLPGPDPETERIFKTLLERNSINNHVVVPKSAVFYEIQDRESIAKELRSLIKRVKRGDSHACQPVYR